MPHEPPLTTLTLFGYSPSERAWAFAKMGLARPALDGVEGLRFRQLLGTGRGGGMGPGPDWSRYGLLAVWESAESADAFFAESALMREYRRHAREIWTVRLLPVQARGAWEGKNPFLPTGARGETAGPVAVLTRAAIRWRRLAAFWGTLPAASRRLARADGLVAAVGIGEAPFVRQATFSLWRSEADVRAYAYESVEHREAIRRTREERWYSEELFARFAPVASEGSWNGRDPLEELL
jgi:heme-degrading monooxygenase HmoA